MDEQPQRIQQALIQQGSDQNATAEDGDISVTGQLQGAHSLKNITLQRRGLLPIEVKSRLVV